MPLSRLNDPITSKLAADMAEQFAGSHEQKIRQALITYGPSTKDEIAAVTGLDHVAVARRLSEMSDCYPTGDTRESKSFRPERVWAIRAMEKTA